jgi:hypothetical protein
MWRAAASPYLSRKKKSGYRPGMSSAPQLLPTPDTVETWLRDTKTMFRFERLHSQFGSRRARAGGKGPSDTVRPSSRISRSYESPIYR